MAKYSRPVKNFLTKKFFPIIIALVSVAIIYALLFLSLVYLPSTNPFKIVVLFFVKITGLALIGIFGSAVIDMFIFIFLIGPLIKKLQRPRYEDTLTWLLLLCSNIIIFAYIADWNFPKIPSLDSMESLLGISYFIIYMFAWIAAMPIFIIISQNTKTTEIKKSIEDDEIEPIFLDDLQEDHYEQATNENVIELNDLAVEEKKIAEQSKAAQTNFEKSWKEVRAYATRHDLEHFINKPLELNQMITKLLELERQMQVYRSQLKNGEKIATEDIAPGALKKYANGKFTIYFTGNKTYIDVAKEALSKSVDVYALLNFDVFISTMKESNVSNEVIIQYIRDLYIFDDCYASTSTR